MIKKRGVSNSTPFLINSGFQVTEYLLENVYYEFIW